MRRVEAAFIVTLGAAWICACGSSTQSVTGPSTVKCSVNASASPSTFSATGGKGTLAVTTNRECQWNAAPSTKWIQLGNSSGQGDGAVTFTVASNTDPAARQGAITVSDRQVAISQQAAPCDFTLNRSRDSVAPSGERKTIAVTASSPQCTWTARSDVSWLVIVEGAQGTGNGQVTYEARASTGPSRTGTLRIAGHAVTVSQGEGCNTTIAPTSHNVPAGGGSGTIAVSTETGCTWTARSDVPWISVTSGQTGTGPGAVAFSVGPWDGPARRGTLTVDGIAFTVNQASGCRYTIDPASQSVAAAGGTGTVNVRTATGCGWSAGSNVSWLTITAGASGTGEGHVQFVATATTGPARSGTLTIAGQAFTVNQASGCTYTLVPSSLDVADEGGTFSFTVNTSGGCTWTATSSASWVTVIGSASGSGNGSVTFRVAANAMGAAPRSASISVESQAFTVNQAAGVPCVYNLNPASRDVSAAAGSSSFSVQTVLTCPWTAYSNASWIEIDGFPSGAGNGSVRFTYAENPPGSPPRSGTITVNGQIFTLNQAAPGTN